MQAGGFGYEVPAGRRDGRISLVNETFTNLPPPTLNVDQLTQAYAKKSHKKKWSPLPVRTSHYSLVKLSKSIYHQLNIIEKL